MSVQQQVVSLSDGFVKNIQLAVNLLKTVEEAERWRRRLNKTILILSKLIKTKSSNENLFKDKTIKI